MAEEQPYGTEEQPPGTGAEPGPDEGPGAAAEGSGVSAADAGPKRRTPGRSSTDKVIAGVAGGIGAYFGIDAVIVRIAFIVLAFMGGAGLFLYLIGWLALPKEDSRSVLAMALSGDSPHRFRSLLAVVLIGIGLFFTANLSGSLFGLFIGAWSISPFLALVLIAAGVALVLWPGPARRPAPAPARPPAPPVAPPGMPPPASAYPTPVPPPLTGAGPEWSPPAGGPAPAAERRRQRSVIGSLTVAVLLVYAGGVVMLERLDAFDVDIGVFFAAAVAIAGAGLLVSAFTRPARGLVPLAVALCAPLLLFFGADAPWGSGVGEARVTVTNVETLEDEYRHGVGRLVVDLSDLELGDSPQALDLSISIGEVRVYVPDRTSTTADINVGTGNIRVRGAGYLWVEDKDGLSVSRTITVPPVGETAGELRLDIDVGIGQAEVVTVPAPIGGTTGS